MSRKTISPSLKLEVLIEAGYRCAIPTCREILAIDLHHIIPVAENGQNELSNLIALCPMCHALYERGTISKEAISFYKGMLVSLNQAFDKESIDLLLLLDHIKPNHIELSGDGFLKVSRLIYHNYVTYDFRRSSLQLDGHSVTLYNVTINEKGKGLIDAWKSGDRNKVKELLNPRSD